MLHCAHHEGVHSRSTAIDTYMAHYMVVAMYMSGISHLPEQRVILNPL